MEKMKDPILDQSTNTFYITQDAIFKGSPPDLKWKKALWFYSWHIGFYSLVPLPGRGSLRRKVLIKMTISYNVNQDG